MHNFRINTLFSLFGLFSLIAAFVFVISKTSIGDASLLAASFNKDVGSLIIVFVLTTIFLVSGIVVTLASFTFSLNKAFLCQGCLELALFFFFLFVSLFYKDNSYFRDGINETCSKYLISLGISASLYVVAGAIGIRKQ